MKMQLSNQLLTKSVLNKATIPSLFRYNCICVISDGLEAKVGIILLILAVL